ncbi:MAG: precorrin-2 C(20)-methyltransferase [Deltaproteobacteria bacterium]|nr:precorrin-2 C(20)-methyltransferase [Deltaproteobacteria bacterium]
MKTGTFYGIGVGPGDPELVTMKAVRILRKVDVVFAASSTKNEGSLAAEIVSRYLKKDIPVRLLGFPMTRRRETLKEAWRENGRRLLDVLLAGKDAAFVTLGDPTTYSTFGYTAGAIREAAPEIPIVVIPGITSYQAATAATCRSLAEAEESFTVVSGALGADRLKEVIHTTDNVVILKVYRNFREIREALEELGLTSGSILVSRCGLEGEEIVYDLRKYPDKTPPYLSLILVRKKGVG